MDAQRDGWDPDDERTVIQSVSVRHNDQILADWRHTIVVVQGPEPGLRVTVDDGGLTIGRKAPATVRVPEPEVSALHCEIQTMHGRDHLLVIDRASTNGCFVDGRRVVGQAAWVPGGLLQVGSNVFRHEYQPRAAADAALEVDRDLQKASSYVAALLPPPLRSDRIHADWFFRPSARLGGDAFGYQILSDDCLVGYMIDVCGHGAGSAMHSVSVLNLLRQRALPDTDFSQPAQVLDRLNRLFQMDGHGNLFFTIWYGVYDARAGTLTHAGGGHHPVYLRAPRGDSLLPLQVRNPPIGVLPEAVFAQQTVNVAADSRLYAFSDGAFEFVDKDGRSRGLADFVHLLTEPAVPGLREPERLFRRVRELAAVPVLEDDFSALVVTFLSH
ncbi:MAG TPA: SpoIIE family protein phosphatase [Rubrivivax sp.]|nr:SpoIIE family protein phosphatase [Rubrivivax sp.]